VKEADMGSVIEFATKAQRMSGYLALPKDKPQGKGILVLQEWWGLVPHIKDVADRFASLGYAALAPDLWDGEQATSPDEAGRLFMALEIERAETQIRGAIRALREQGHAQGKIGVVGFCMGGQLALYAACTLGQDIGACVDFYGVHPRVKPDFAQLKAPVLGLFGERDGSVPPQTVAQLGQAIREHGGSFTEHTYPAPHAFFNDTRKDVYDAKAAADAWRRTLEFFAKHL
jgi:carboxymethylenebutenolidase